MAQDYSPFEMAVGALVIGALVVLGIIFYLYWPLIILIGGAGAYAWWYWRGKAGVERRLQAEQRELFIEAQQAFDTAAIPLPDNFVTNLIDDLKTSDRCPHFNILLKLFHATGELYCAEFLPLTLPPAVADSIDGAAWRSDMRAYITKLSNPDVVTILRDTLMEAYVCFTAKLPDAAIQTEDEVNEAADALTEDRSDTEFLLPLTELHPKPTELIEELALTFFRKEADGFFVTLRKQLDENLSAIPEKLRASSALPSKYTGPEPVQAYLRDTPLARIFEAAVPFSIPQHLRYEGQWIIAPPGRGKTTLLSAMFAADMNRDASIIVMDSKGDLLNPIRRLKGIEDRLVILEPDGKFPLALNPLDISKDTEDLPAHERELHVMRAVSRLEQLFGGLFEAGMTPLQSRFFRIVLRSIVTASPQPTLATLRSVCQGGYKEHIDLAKLSEEDRSFFLKEFSSKTYADTSNQVLWRLGLMLDNPIFRDMFSASETKVDMAELMDSRKIVLINNSKANLDDAGAEFFGRFFIALVRSAAQRRSKLKGSEKVPVFFYIDECHSVISRDDNIATIIDECRSQKIALILAHQRVSQIKSPNVLDALANCAIRFANSDEDARYLAPRLFAEPDFMRQPRGSFAAFARDLTPRAISLQVPLVRLGELPRTSTEEYQQVMKRVRDRYCYDRNPSPAEPLVNLHHPDLPWKLEPGPPPTKSEDPNTGPTTNY